jgi:nucleoside-diphosphate-sugar epimerase
MQSNPTVLVLGATGQMGTFFMEYLIKSNLSIKAFVRKPEQFKFRTEQNVECIQGDATDFDAVKAAMEDVDIVVSCLGNPKGRFIMEIANKNIMRAAAAQKTAPKCMIISSIGLGGSSWFVKALLSLIAGKQAINDGEKADKIVRETKDVPFILIRPAGLTNKDETNYTIIHKPSIFFPKFMSRKAVAKFLIDHLQLDTYLNKAVLIQG